jgi:hypothetical protein
LLGDIDYSKYLSIDNGNGLLLRRDDIDVLTRYGFDYRKYFDLGTLIFDIDHYISYNLEDSEELELVVLRLSERYYYNSTKK